MNPHDEGVGRPRRAHMIMACALSLLVSACAFVRLRERGLERKLRRHDLAAESVELGPHRVYRWRSEGDGRPVLFLHGFGPPAIWQWHPQVDPVAGCRPIIMPDLLGFGGSTTSASLSFPSQVDALLRLLDAEGVGEVDVVGVSYGGMVAMELALRAPQRVHSLVLVSSPGRAFDPADQVPLVRSYGVDGMDDLLLPRDAVQVRRLLHLAYHRPPRVPRWLLGEVQRALYRQRRPEKEQILAQIPIDYAQVAEQPWELQVPTLVVWGAEDRVFPLDSGVRLATTADEVTRLVVIEDAGHVPNLERKGVFNRELLAFLGCRP